MKFNNISLQQQATHTNFPFIADLKYFNQLHRLLPNYSSKKMKACHRAAEIAAYLQHVGYKKEVDSIPQFIIHIHRGGKFKER